MILKEQDTGWKRRAWFGAKWGALSALALGAPLLALAMWWYPGEFFWADGGWQGISWMLPLVVLSGAFAAAAVLKKDRKHLAMDMAALGVGQAALTVFFAGMLWQESPAALVLEGKIFHSVPQRVADSDWTVSNMAKGGSVRLYQVKLPGSAKETLGEAQLALKKGVPIFAVPKFWSPLDWSGAEMRKAMIFAPEQVKAKEGAKVAQQAIRGKQTEEEVFLVSLRFDSGVMTLKKNSRASGHEIVRAPIGLVEAYMLET